MKPKITTRCPWCIKGKCEKCIGANCACKCHGQFGPNRSRE